MFIQPANAWPASVSAISPRASLARTEGIAAANVAASENLAERTNISQAARDLLAAETKAAGNPATSTAVFDTNQGAMTLDIDAYFQPPPGGFAELPPLMMPSANNIKALTDHVSARMPDFLARHGIPEAPSSVGYDRNGEPQFPADYPYAKEFKAALADDPVMARSMQSAAALSSVHVEMQKSLPFHEEYSAANSAADAAKVVAKYAWLFADNRPSANITLNFSADGRLSVSADGEPISWAAG